MRRKRLVSFQTNGHAREQPVATTIESGVVRIRVDSITEHAAAAIVPEMAIGEWKEFKSDVQERGVQDPIAVVRNGASFVLIDGRHRLRASRELGYALIPARALPLCDKQQLEWILRSALLRRHLSESQRAMLGARLKHAYAAKARERRRSVLKRGRENPVGANLRQRGKGRASDQAAAAVGVSGRSVDHATRVFSHGAESLVEAVEQGRIKVSTAAQLADSPKDVQEAAVRAGPRGVRKAIEGTARARADKPRSGNKLRRTDEEHKRAAQADARRHWLQGVVDLVVWVETFVAGRSDADLAWQNEPDSPGLFDHGLTDKRLSETIKQLQRIRGHTLKRRSKR
jgi:ParB-like chromosome segregation protein Spo0J